jgi:hypothetical protein
VKTEDEGRRRPTIEHSSDETIAKPLKRAVKRSENFKAEITRADPVMAIQLIAAWKEIIMEQFVKALGRTDDLDDLGFLDVNPALILETKQDQ